MNLPEHTTNSFVVRIWLEETAEEANTPSWRGHVTHIPSNVRRYIENVDDIANFIVPYLEALGIRVNQS
jgi:hypothetical protein